MIGVIIMPNYIGNLGLDFIFENEETMMGFMGYLTQNGKAIKGYYDCPTLFNPMGSIDFFVKTRKDEEGKLVVCDVDTHCCGRNIWEMRNTGIDVTPKDSLPTERVFIFKSNEDGSGMVPIHLINADVLPSFLNNDVVKMQMCAFPLDMNYYANEDDYAEHQPEGKDGKRWLLADGSLMPVNFLVNHAPNEDGEEKDCATDDYVLFKGTVKSLYHGIFEMEDKKDNTFIRCIIETNYGELQFAHTIDQIDPEQRDNLQVGAIVSGVCVLSGDVAIKEYTDGLVKDSENNLRLLKQVIVKGEAERMRTVLTEDAVYVSEASGKSVEGINDIIERFNYVHNECDQECFATTATITSVDSEELEYPVDTRCILISYGTEDDYSAIVFMDMTESGDIKRIYVSKDSRYHFCADPKPQDASPFNDIEIPESVIEPIYNRAMFHGLIDENTNVEDLKNGILEHSIYKDAAERMLDALRENPQPDAEKAFENIFGYLFAKTIELNINETQNDGVEIISEAHYSILDAFEGKISTSFDKEKHDKIVELMEKGKQFYKDFKFYMQLGEPDDNRFMEEILTSLIVVQHIGFLYASQNTI